MKTEECCNCGTSFAMSQQDYEYYKSTGETFCCPRGHKQHYVNTESKQAREIKGLKKELKKRDETIVNLWGRISDLNQEIWYLERKQCPECKKWLKDLEGHQKRMHTLRITA